jgi:EAL domain-containing protein (putative c-di-GMP-specific phosphodiesterase class I)
MVGPGEFVPVAEDSGSLPEIEQYVLASACRTLAKWQREFPVDPALSVAVNVSARRFGDDRLETELAALFSELEIARGSLKLEITESLLLQDDGSVLERLERLRKLGVSLSIDDFGTGYSSLSYLHKLPIDTVKIDQSFIRELTHGSDRAEVVRTILALAQHLGLDVVAEGIETAEQLAQLRAFGCRWAQGYFFARPMPESDAGAQIRREIDVLDGTRSGKVPVRRNKSGRKTRKIA